jgi:hypothetical protein
MNAMRRMSPTHPRTRQRKLLPHPADHSRNTVLGFDLLPPKIYSHPRYHDGTQDYRELEKYEFRGGGLGMWKVAAGLFVVAVLLSAAFLTHGVATGVGVPYPDPTPEQAAYERYHRGISQPLFLAAGVAWLVAVVAAAVSAGLWSLRARHPEPGAAPDRRGM